MPNFSNTPLGNDSSSETENGNWFVDVDDDGECYTWFSLDGSYKVFLDERDFSE